jgi:pseudaminic acid synthase
MNSKFDISEFFNRSMARPYFIAEMSANHNNDFELAVDIIHAAADAGADAIKLQTYKPETMTIDCDREEFIVGDGTQWEGRCLYELYEETHLPWEWHEDLMKEAQQAGLDCFSTAFDETAVEFLEELDVPVHKVASFELVDLPLIAKMAKTGKPLIISTGMGTLGEIEEAVKTARENGCEDLLLMHCTSAYPAPVSEARLKTIPHLSEAFDVPVGLSDHTEGIAVPIAAVSQGACMIEKHFCLSRKIKTPDSSFSLEPAEFKKMVEQTKQASRALGKVSYELTESEKNSLVFRRSIYVVEDVEKGEKITAENTARIRPGFGISPKYYEEILGRKFSCAVKRGTPLDWQFISRS